eukprot:Skav235213  [mRNA]  locus=scaffold3995:15007:23985:+ [translate_table: standard]
MATNPGSKDAYVDDMFDERRELREAWNPPPQYDAQGFTVPGRPFAVAPVDCHAATRAASQQRLGSGSDVHCSSCVVHAMEPSARVQGLPGTESAQHPTAPAWVLRDTTAARMPYVAQLAGCDVTMLLYLSDSGGPTRFGGFAGSAYGEPLDATMSLSCEDWFLQQTQAGNKPKSPATGQPLLSLLLFPNLALSALAANLEMSPVVPSTSNFVVPCAACGAYEGLWETISFQMFSAVFRGPMYEIGLWADVSRGKALGSIRNNMQPAWVQAEKA